MPRLLCQLFANSFFPVCSFDVCVCADSSKTTGACFAYTFLSLSGRCTGFVFDHSSKFVDYVDCGANYGEKLDVEKEDEFLDGLYDYQDEAATLDDYYADLADDDDGFVDSYYADLANTAREECDFKSVTLGVASSKKICKQLCTSCMVPCSKIS